MKRIAVRREYILNARKTSEDLDFADETVPMAEDVVLQILTDRLYHVASKLDLRKSSERHLALTWHLLRTSDD